MHIIYSFKNNLKAEFLKSVNNLGLTNRKGRLLVDEHDINQGSIYIVSGTRENPPLALPWPRKRLAYLFAKFNQPFTLGSRIRLGEQSRGTISL